MAKMNNRISPYRVTFEGGSFSFEEFFRLYYPRLKSYAVKILHDSDEAEDLVQDVFFQIWQKKVKLDTEKNPGSYLFTLLKNKCLNLLRHKVVEEEYALRQVKTKTEELYHISFGAEDEFVSMEEQLHSELEKIIAEMPERCRVAFRLKWIEGKKIREIAEIMEISTTMVDKHLAKGLEIARRKLPRRMFLLLIAPKITR